MAANFFREALEKTDRWLSGFPNLESINDIVRTDLTSNKAIEPVPLYAGVMSGFSGNFPVAEADRAGTFSPGAGGKNSGAVYRA